MWAWGLAVLALCAAAGLIWWRWRRRHFSSTRPPAPPLANQVLAMTLLEDLRSQADALPPPQVGQRVAEIVRTFLHRQFGILARYRTTEEILALRRDASTPPPPPAVRVFEDFLLHLDAVNYGSARSDGPGGNSLVDEGIHAIRKAMDQLQPPREAAAGGAP